MNVNTEGLPPEMQQRIAEIIEKAKSGVAQPQEAAAPAPAPVVRQPSLMDHVIALRQEVAQLGQMVQAQGQVTEAVGNAVGQLYGMFQESPAPATYSSSFQAQPPVGDDDY
jgi:hypothetical protein